MPTPNTSRSGGDNRNVWMPVEEALRAAERPVGSGTQRRRLGLGTVGLGPREYLGTVSPQALQCIINHLQREYSSKIPRGYRASTSSARVSTLLEHTSHIVSQSSLKRMNCSAHCEAKRRGRNCFDLRFCLAARAVSDETRTAILRTNWRLGIDHLDGETHPTRNPSLPF